MVRYFHKSISKCVNGIPVSFKNIFLRLLFLEPFSCRRWYYINHKFDSTFLRLTFNLTGRCNKISIQYCFLIQFDAVIPLLSNWEVNIFNTKAPYYRLYVYTAKRTKFYSTHACLLANLHKNKYSSHYSNLRQTLLSYKLFTFHDNRTQ